MEGAGGDGEMDYGEVGVTERGGGDQRNKIERAKMPQKLLVLENLRGEGRIRGTSSRRHQNCGSLKI